MTFLCVGGTAASKTDKRDDFKVDPERGSTHTE